MMGKIELSVLALLLAITVVTCLPDQVILQKLPLAEPTKPTRLHSQAAKAHVRVAEATAYNPSLYTKPPVISSPLPILATNPQPSPPPSSSPPEPAPSSPPPPPPSSLSPPPPPPPPASSTLCPIDASLLNTCTSLVIGGGLVFGQLVMKTCCPALVGLATLEAQLCLCTSFGSGLGFITFHMDPVRGVLEACGRSAPPGPLCSI